MTPSQLRTTAGLIGLTVALLLAHTAEAGPERPSTADAAFFEKEVVPLLKANCLKCHGEGKVRGGLRLTSRKAILEGGDTGPAVSLHQPDQSLLLKAVRHQDGLEMPPRGKLAQKDVNTLTRWVHAGLPWATGAVAAEERTYWAYQPVRRPAVPEVKDTAWAGTPVDTFILARLEAQGLRPNPPADRAALVRRLYYDLTGLPPTPAEVDTFIHDSSAGAYERLVDRLLASPHYGEKWGRHWLDLVRYAETNGYERDSAKPFAWRFRDYVIRSFNDDKPFDRFVKEQLAGDEMPGYNPDAVIATGYYRLGLWDDEPVDRLQARYDQLDDVVATTAQVFLGTTMNCARCHDHKIDPIPQRDYYRLLAFFQDVQPYDLNPDPRSAVALTDISPPAARAANAKELEARDTRLAQLRDQMRTIEDRAIHKMSAEDQRAAEGPERPQVIRRKLGQFLTAEELSHYRRLAAELRDLRRRPAANRELALSVNHCPVDPGPTHVLIRGNAHAPGARVEPGFPTALGTLGPVLPRRPGAKSSGRRTVLADWIASRDNPLTARVLVNRLWQHHFGRGLVASSNDFGKFGTPPTHPELLDYLADELVRGGWQLKRMHRLILLSSAYRMSSRASAEGLRADPANTLFWRFNMQRLTAEEVRDSVLAVSGKLNPRMGGPSVFPPISKEVLAGQSVPGDGWSRSSPQESARRSVYVHVKRSLLVPVLAQHDQADTDSSCPVRYTTTVPTQALGLLNGDFTNEQAAALAGRLRRELPGSLEGQVRLALRLTTGRSPAADEVRKDAAFVRDLQTQGKLDEAEALRQYCLLLLNTNEFVYLD